jgi:MGT family glycosyltransferase
VQPNSGSRTVVFFPEGAFGPTNNCVGIGEALKRHGHRVVFVVEESFAGTLEAKGFEERLMRLKPRPEVPEEPGQFWKDFIRETAPQFRRPTFEQLEGLIAPIWTELIDGSKYVDPRLREIFDEVSPDVIVQDNVVAFPAALAAGVPWVRIVSCNPLELKDPDLPPTFSGYPSTDRVGWEEFRKEYERTHADLWADFDQFVTEGGAGRLPNLEFIHESPFLNLYIYPAEADYERSRPLGPAWSRLESCVRETEAKFELPEALRRRESALVYLSLGSLGSADTELMGRLIEILSETPHRFIVSKGPQHAQIELADNMWGEEYLPQPSILPLVDLVITHGGNNTVTECLHFGKPMVVLPLFWDQYDNAQRIDELGLGVRLPTYDFEAADLSSAIGRLLSDADLRARLRAMAIRLQSSRGTVRAASLIERVATEKRPVASGRVRD